VIVIGVMIIDIFPMRIPPGLLLASLFILAGCSTTDNMRPVPIAGGKVVGIQFGPQGPLPGKADGYEVRFASMVPATGTNSVVYKFAFSAPAGVTLKHVVVDDISDEQSSPLIDDQQPWVDNNFWHNETKPFENKNPLLAWVYTVTPSMRVYRFTITDAAGKHTVLYQLTGYPEFIKASIRRSWGEKY
jgi:hypothetical protein